jgi:hypothetical protein
MNIGIKSISHSLLFVGLPLLGVLGASGIGRNLTAPADAGVDLLFAGGAQGVRTPADVAESGTSRKEIVVWLPA